MHHVGTYRAWSCDDQAIVEIPVMKMTGKRSPCSWSMGLDPHTCGVWAMVPVLEGTGMGVH